MKRLLFGLMIIGSLSAMDGEAEWRAQIVREWQHEEIFIFFQIDEFQHKKLNTREIDRIKDKLSGLRSTAGYTHLNAGLLGLAKKSYFLENLEGEIIFAQMLLDAGADMYYKQAHALPMPKRRGVYTEADIAALGHSVEKITVFHTPVAFAKGDLHELFNKKAAQIKE